jgi:SagB-type dehydrogenase family enzyme
MSGNHGTGSAGDTTHEVRAVSMLSAVANDPQFDLPARPAFVSGVVLVQLPSGLLVDGTGERKIFRGGAAQSLLPRLVPLLDGTRDDVALAAELWDVRLTDVQAALALLYTSGLLEASREDSPSDLVPKPVRQFAGRHLDTTRANRNTREVVDRLHRTRVGVFAGNGQVQALLSQMRACGLSCGSAAAAAAGQYDLMVGVETGGANPGLLDLDDACAAAGVPWLRIAARGTALELGPRFDRRCTACYRCFVEGDTHPSERAGQWAAKQWAALAAQEVFFLVSRVGAAASSRASYYTKVDFREWTTRQTPFVRHVGCAVCCPADPAPADRLPIAYAYDQSVTWPPRDLVFPKAHQAHYKIANALLQGEQRLYQSGPQVRLPRPGRPCPPTGRSRAARPSSQHLSEILLAAFGIRSASPGQPSRRCAPTGGNLGSPQAFLALHGVSGLPDGIFCYQPFGHSLAILDSRPPGSLGIDNVPDDAGATIIVTSMLVRVARKYGSLAFKLCALDAGVALQQVRVMAESLSVSCMLAHSWNEAALARRIGAAQPDEPIMGVAVLGGRDLAS